MLLALALYVSTANADVPHYDFDLLYHDGRAQAWTSASSFGSLLSPPRCALV